MPCAVLYTDTCLEVFNSSKNIEQHPLKDLIKSPLRCEFRKFDETLSNKIELLYTEVRNEIKAKYIDKNAGILTDLPREYYKEIDSLEREMQNIFDKGLEHELKFYSSCFDIPDIYNSSKSNFNKIL